MNWFKKPTETVEAPMAERSDEWNQRHRYEPMEVVRNEDGSLDPNLDYEWNDATKLQWCAGVLKADTGFVVTFYQPASGRKDKVDWSAFGMMSPNGAGFSSLRWTDFSLFGMGVEWGIEWARNQAGIDDDEG